VCDGLGWCDTAWVYITINNLNDAPLGEQDDYTVLGNEPFNGDISINDMDADNDPLSFGVVTNPTNGVAVISPDGVLTFTANDGYFGMDSLAYSICDTTSLCDTVWVYFNIIDPSLYPSALDDLFEMNEDMSLDSTVSVNDLTLDSLTYTLFIPPAVGVLTFNIDGTFGYIPPADFNGQVSFEYIACDTSGTCDTAVVTIQVWPVNDAPLAVDDAYTITQDTTLEDDVAINDTDIDSNDLTITLLENASNGTVTLESDGSFSYVPNAGFLGLDTFTYVLCDTALCDTALVIITIEAFIPIPNALDDNYTMLENTILTEDASSNDENTNGFVYTVLAPPSNGSVTMASDGTFVYTPNSGFVGIDTFTYNACDNLGNCYEALVTIEVQDDPSNNDTEVRVPGGFSPNGDYIGDTFIIENIDLYPNNSLQIFNRWGNTIYERDGYRNESAWDGTTESGGAVIGELAPEGTYFYILDKGDGSAHKQGFFMIKYEQK
jgi:gliding motility-associated-like protein